MAKPNKKITVFGTGYVGFSLAVLLSSRHKVIAYDIDISKVKKINKKISPLYDPYLEKYFVKSFSNISATSSVTKALKGCDWVILATPTNYDEKKNSFDVSSIESSLIKINKLNKKVKIVIKSTIPIGFTRKLAKNFSNEIIFSPEFLREGRSLWDNHYPSRVIAGGKKKAASEFANLLIQSSKVKKSNLPVVLTSYEEAESIKLFSNTYLAMRVAYFNELDNFCIKKGLDARSIIEGISHDPRIGNWYNNPSFGYGGYCLPKDTKQLNSNFNKIPHALINAIVDSNQDRKTFIANEILKKKPKIVGVYRLIMKQGSDNFRESAVFEIIKILMRNDVQIHVYEPNLNKAQDLELVKDLKIFISKSDVIITNRMDNNTELMSDKLFTRDIFQEN